MGDRRARRRRPLLAVAVIVGTVAGFVVAYQFVDPAPPSEITLAAGDPDGAYHRYAERYRAILARDGITLHVRESQGAVENLELLRDVASGVDVAFLQSGTRTEKKDDPLIALASVVYEPLWIFLRGASTSSLLDLKGKRLAIGDEGSGTRRVVERMLVEAGVSGASTRLLPLGGSEAASALARGEVDAAFFVASMDAPFIRDLLRNEELDLISLDRSPAYARRHRNLASVTLLEGVIDFERNIPRADVRLLAPVTTLAARNDFHPALVARLLAAADQIHGRPGVFEDKSEFPSSRYLDFPQSAEAARYLSRGPSFLHRFLPFWVANTVERMAVMLIPILTLLIPLFKLAPVIYRWGIRSRFKRWYRDLQAIDVAIGLDGDGADCRSALNRLETIESELGKVTVPPAYGDELYHMRFHVSLVRDRVRRLSQQETSTQKAALISRETSD